MDDRAGPRIRGFAPVVVSSTDARTGPREFELELISGLLRASHAFEPHNVDRWRFPLGGLRGLKGWARDAALAAARRHGFLRARGAGPASKAKLTYVLEHLDDLGRLYGRLGDAPSQHLLIELLKYRILGRDHVRLPTNDARYWEIRASIEREYLRSRSASRSSDGEPLHRYAVPGTGQVIQVLAHPLDILNVFLLQQYAYRRGPQPVEVHAGDVVIDGGGCWGDSALYFADRTGEAGQVHTFEFVPANLEILHRNLGLNPRLAGRISVVAAALWDCPDHRVQYTAAGAATTVTAGLGAGAEASTRTIDQYVAQCGLPRVDYIKLDIEGSECRALSGAETTLRRWRPTLAIALYHRLEDFVDIPEYLASLDLGYRFFLGHFTIHAEETILFATADDRG